MLISLCQETKREHCHRVVTPRSIQCSEKSLSVLESTDQPKRFKQQFAARRTRDSIFRNRLLKSASSGDVVRMTFNRCTIKLANSRSWNEILVNNFWKDYVDVLLASSFSRISANVRKMRSVRSVRHSCRMMRLPRVSNNRRSVLNNWSRLIKNALK